MNESRVPAPKSWYTDLSPAAREKLLDFLGPRPHLFPPQPGVSLAVSAFAAASRPQSLLPLLSPSANPIFKKNNLLQAASRTFPNQEPRT